MSLRSKIILILSVVVGLYAVFDNGVARFMAAESFERWEREQAAASFEQVSDLIEDQVTLLAEKADMWAGLGDRGGLFGPEGEVLVERLGPGSLGEAGVDLFFVVGAEGEHGRRVLWSRVEEPGGDEEIRLREFPSEALARAHPLCQSERLATGGGVAGLMITSRGPLFVASREIGRAVEGDGAPGTRPLVVLGRFFDEGLRAALGSRATVELSIVELDAFEFADDELRDEVTSSPGVVARASDDVLRLFQTVNDVRGRPTILVEAGVERVITARGRTASNYALLSTLATALLILLVLLRLLQHIVIRPLFELKEHAERIGRTDDTTLRSGIERDDEIGTLSREFDSMVGKLARSREELVVTARKAGMSEIATGVLHNVGNVLNSVNVSTSLVAKRAQELAVGDLAMMTDVLKQHADDLGAFVTDDPRGRHLLPFLEELSGALQRQREAIVEEVAGLTEGVEHIAELVRSQQTFAGTKGVFEMASLPEQVEAAIRMCEQAYGCSDEVTLERDFQEAPSVAIDKNKFMEILVNLLNNARQALAEGGGGERRIVLRIGTEPGGDAFVAVEDNGPGIPEENLERIFHHGFTTKPSGHGFGLHVSANAATEMGASLHAESDGPGRGARFVLRIPARSLEAAKAA